jgi:Invasion associated locus B (IalB) protein
MRRALPLMLIVLAATPALARDALGLFGSWAAFRDGGAGPRCYAIAKAMSSTKRRDYQPYADVAWWPKQAVRGQVHFRLSRKLKPGAPIVLSIGGQRLNLVGGGGDAWAADKRMDAAVIAAMRSASEMTVSARDADGQGFSNTWQLEGAATAMDAAAVGCAGVK